MEILYEDNHLLVVNKPAGWVVQGASPDQWSLLDWGKDYLKQKYQKPGNVFLGVVSRLDAWVTGAVPLARTSKAASRLSEQLRERTVTKLYWAIVEGTLSQESGSLVHWLVRDEQETVTKVIDAPRNGAQRGELEYRKLKSTPNGDLVEIKLITGRKHQIRAQFNEIGLPVLGDRKYGSHNQFPAGIALHCRRLLFKHPTQDLEINLEAPLPEYWPAECMS